MSIGTFSEVRRQLVWQNVDLIVLRPEEDFQGRPEQQVYEEGYPLPPMIPLQLMVWISRKVLLCLLGNMHSFITFTDRQDRLELERQKCQEETNEKFRVTAETRKTIHRPGCFTLIVKLTSSMARC